MTTGGSAAEIGRARTRRGDRGIEACSRGGGLRKVLGRHGGEAFAEDVAQEALLRILDSPQSFAGRSRFTTWAMAIAVRVGISELRRKRFQDVSLEQVTGGENLSVDPAVDLPVRRTSTNGVGSSWRRSNGSWSKR